MKTFDVYPLLAQTPVKAANCIVTCADGKEYLDLYGGHAVISIGHSHPEYVSALSSQLGKIGFYSNAVQNPLQEILAEKFAAVSGYPQHSLFLCNSGAEANENALKLASFHNGRKKIVAIHGSFHGRTSASVASTDDPTISSSLNLQHEVDFISMNDFASAQEKIDHTCCAVIIEGIQGVGGVQEPSSEFLQFLRKKCSETGTILILDEIQSGCGRTGNYFAHQFAGIEADIITMAKGIGNGFPIGAVLIAPFFKARHGLLGTTFGGNYLACTSALTVIDVMAKENLMNNAKTVGEYLVAELKKAHQVKDVRGKGLMIGIEFEFPCAPVRKALLEEHQIFTGSSSCKRTMRLLPPLTLTKDQADIFLQSFQTVLQSQIELAQ